MLPCVTEKVMSDSSDSLCFILTLACLFTKYLLHQEWTVSCTPYDFSNTASITSMSTVSIAAERSVHIIEVIFCESIGISISPLIPNSKISVEKPSL